MPSSIALPRTPLPCSLSDRDSLVIRAQAETGSLLRVFRSTLRCPDVSSRPGAIVICDFSEGFRPPEMVKIRPVVVISPRRRTAQLVTVVPLSSVAPLPVQPWHYQLPPGAYRPPVARSGQNATW
jgi:hypothetical protein